MKECLLSTAVMAYFDTGKETLLVVDVSPVGIGAMLVQDGHIVSYASCALSDVGILRMSEWRWQYFGHVTISICTSMVVQYKLSLITRC